MKTKKRLTIRAALAAGALATAGTIGVMTAEPASAKPVDCKQLALTRDYNMGMYNWYHTFGPYMPGWGSETLALMYVSDAADAATESINAGCR